MSGGKDWNNLDGGPGKPHAKQDGKPDLQELMRRRFQNRPSSTVSDSDNNASPTPISQPVSGGAFRPLSQGAQSSSGGQNAQGAHLAQNATATDNNGNFVYENHFENSAMQHESAFRSKTDKGHGIKHQSKNDQRGGQSSQTATPEVFENNFEDMESAGASGSHGYHRDASGGSQKRVKTDYSENLGYPGSETGKTKGNPAGQGRDTHEIAQFGERRIPPGSQAPVHFAGFGGMGGASGATASPQSVPKNDTGEGGAAARRWNTNKDNRCSAPGKIDPMAQLLAFAEAHKNDSDSEETKKKRKEEEKKLLEALEQEYPDFVSTHQNTNQNKQQEERQNDGMVRHGRGGRGGGFSMQSVGDIDEKELKEIMRGKDGKSGLMGEQISDEKMIELSQEMIGKKENKDNQSENVDQKLKRRIDQGCVDQDGKVDPVLQMLAGMGAGQVEDGVENPMTKMLNEARMNEGQGQGQDDGGGGGDPFAQLLSGMRGMGRGQRPGQGGGGGDPFAGMGGMGAGQGGGQGGNPADPIAQFMGGMRGRGGGQAGNPIGPFMGGMGGGQGGNNANQFGQMIGGMGGGGGGQKEKMEEDKEMESPDSKQGSGGQMNEDELLAQTMSGMSQGDKGRQGSGRLGMREDPLAQILGGMRGGRQGGPDRNAMAGLMGGGGQGGPNMNMLAQMMGGGGLAGRGGGGCNPMAQMMDSLMGGSGPAGGGGNPMAQMLGGMMGRGGGGGGGGMDPMQLMAQMAGGGGGGGIDPMQLMSQMAGGGMGRGNDDQVAAMAQMMGQGRGRGQMMEEEEVIDIENPKEDQIVKQMLGYEKMKAASCRDQRSDGMCTIIILDTSASMTGEPMTEAGRFISEFINGLEEAQFEYGLEENMAIICVGAQEHVAQHLTCDYTLIRSVIDAQFPEGPSRLHHGLILPIATLTSRGGRDDFEDFITNTNGHRVCPRIIVISDGHVNNREDIPGQTPAEGDQETLMFQNICLEFTQHVTQQTMCTVHCVPVGAANIPFLEMLANSTGGQLIQPADAKKISRCYLHHHLVGLLQKDGTDMSNRSVVAASINQALACSDDEDVNGVMKIFADGEPDIEAHKQALAKWMAEQQTQRGQRQGGMQDMQGMMEQLSGGGLPGMMGGGGRGGMPAMMGGGGRGGMHAMMGGGGRGGMPAMMGGGRGGMPAMMGGGGRIPAMMGGGGRGGMPAMMGGGGGGMPAMMGDGGGGIPAMMGGGGGRIPAMLGGGGGRIPAMMRGGRGGISAMMGGRQGEKEADGAGQVGGNEKVGNRQFKAGDISELPTDVITMMGINKNDKPGKASERKDAEASFEGNNGGGKGEGIPNMAQSIGGRKPGDNEGGDGMPDMLAMMGGLGGGGGGGPGGGEGGPGGMPDLSALLSGLAAGKGGGDAGGLPDMSTMMGGGRGVGGMGGMSAMMGGGRGGGGAGGLPDMSAMMGALRGVRGRGGAGGLPDMSAMMGGLGGGRVGGGAGGLPDMSAMMGGRGGGGAGGLPDMSAMMGGLGGGGGVGGLPDMSAMMGGLGGGRERGGNAGGMPDMPSFLGGRKPDNMSAPPGDGRGGGGVGGMSDFSAVLGGGGGGGVGAGGMQGLAAMFGVRRPGGGDGGGPDMNSAKEPDNRVGGMPRLRKIIREFGDVKYGHDDIENMLRESEGGQMGEQGNLDALMKRIDESTGYNAYKARKTDPTYEDKDDDAMSISTISTADGRETAVEAEDIEEEDNNTHGADDKQREDDKQRQGDIAAGGGHANGQGLAGALFGKGLPNEKKSEYDMETLQELLMCIRPENFKGNPDGEQPLQDLVGQGQFQGGQAGNAGMQGMGRSQEYDVLYQRNAANNRQSYQPPQQDAQRPSTMGAESGFPQPQRAGGQYQQHGQMRHGQGQGAQGYGQPQQQARPGQYGQARGQQEDYNYGNQDDMSGMEEPD